MIAFRSVLESGGGGGEIPDGRTVTPVNDVQTWLACAGITDKSYTILSEVLADSTTLLALINHDNANAYLVRCFLWVYDICSSQTAMTYIGNNNNCSAMLLSNETWLMTIANSSYYESVLNTSIPVMTSNTTPSGEASASGVWKSGYEAYKAFNGNASQTQGWINNNYTGGWLQYDFGVSVRFYCFGYKGGVNGSNLALKNFKLQGSNDNSNFDDLTDTITNANSTLHTFNRITKRVNYPYRYIRMDCGTTGTVNAYNGVAVFQVYGRIAV